MAREGRKVGVDLGGAGHCRHIPEIPARLSPCPLFLHACPGRSLVPSPHPRPPTQGPPKCSEEGAARLLGRRKMLRWPTLGEHKALRQSDRQI